jgi:hypothetical protein
MHERLAELLRGGPDPPPVPADVEDLLAVAAGQGVLPLLAERWAASGPPPTGPVARVIARIRDDAAADLVREAELVTLLEALASSGVAGILFKGAALAYLYYARPHLRPRLDTDVLIDRADRPGADAVLTRLGYVPVPQLTADLISYQQVWTRRREGTIVHVVDVHWRLTNPQQFGDVLGYAEAASRAVPVPALGPAARALGPVDALLAACVHRVAHHGHAPLLIWTVDVDRLARRLSAEEWRQFVDLADVRGVRAICADGLAEAARWLDAPVPAWVADRFAASGPVEPTAEFLKRRRHIAVVAQDLQALPHWRDRMRLVRQHLLPPAAYMREVYAPRSGSPLPMLYVRRAWRGARKWLARS